MKKCLSVLLSIVMLLTVIPVGSVSAYAATSGDANSTTAVEYEYTVLEDGTAEITRYTGTATDLTIPSTLDGYSVTSIGYDAFSGCKSLTSITIPDSVTGIGWSAFTDCTSLANIMIGSGVTSISYDAFSGCTGLTNIKVDDNNANYSSLDGVLFNKEKTMLIQYPAGNARTEYAIPDSVISINGAFSGCTSLANITIGSGVTSIGEYEFSGCTSLTIITISDSVTSIGEYAFSGCESLASITIGNSVTSIGKYAFSGCKSLASITIGNGVTSIGYGAFYGCTSLTSVKIPDSVTSIGEVAFRGCTSLTNLEVNDNNANYSSLDGVLFNKDKTELIQYPVGNKRTEYPIPDSVTSIEGYAFYGCTGLTSVTIPDSVTSIGEYAFYGCTGLTSVTIPDSVTSMGGYAFFSCTNLTSIIIGNGVTSIDYGAFYGCTSLTNITIPDSVTSIDYNAFYCCTNLKSITIPDSVTSIDYNAFSGCESLTGIKVNDNNANYSSLDGVLFNKDKTELIIYPVGNTRTEYSIPDSVTSIGGYAFRDCASLTNIRLNNGVISIGDQAFFYCTSLVNITLPDSLTGIGYEAFYGCKSLTNVTIPDRLASIGIRAFYDCSSLASISIPDSVTSIGEGAFHGCTSLTNFEVNDNNANYSSLDGVLFNKDKTELIQNPAGNTITEYAIPDSVISIGEEAFSGCTSLTSIKVNDNNPHYSSLDGVLFNKDKTALIQYPAGSTRTEYLIPDSVSRIWYGAFSGCTSLKSVTIPDSITFVDAGAFYDCTSLKSVTIPDSVAGIAHDAFANCTSLKSVTIPDSVTSIYYCAFSSCTSLTNVTIGNGVTSIDFNAFWDCTSLTSFEVDDNNASYSSLDGVLFNKDKTELLQYPDGNTRTEYSIPDSVTSIDASAFDGCTNLTSVAIPDSVTSIYYCAFSGCTSLKDVYYGGSEADWKKISFDEGNDALLDANIHFVGIEYEYKVLEDGMVEITEYTGTETNPAIPSTLNGRSVTSIGDSAFNGCTSLTSITIPESVTSIRVGAFSGCASLTSFEVNDNNANYSSIDGVLFNKEKTMLIQYPIGNTREEYSIPDSVTSIGSRAFDGCTSLTSVTIPDSITSIDGSAFCDCTGLTDVYYGGSEADWNEISFGEDNDALLNASIHFLGIEYKYRVLEDGTAEITGCTGSATNLAIPSTIDGHSVTSIGDWAFSSCISLTSVTIPDSVTSIGDGAFSQCASLTSATLPDSVTTIGSNAFSQCTSLTSVTIPDSVTSIGYGAFYGCTSLTSVKIPDSVTSIGEVAFDGCTSLTNLEVNDNNANYSSLDGVLYNKDKTELIQYPVGNTRTEYSIPDSVTSIGQNAFKDCTSLTSIRVNNGVTSIGDWAFSGCKSLTSVNIPDGVTSIGENAFIRCTSLTSITIPDSVTSIGGDWAFSECTSLANIKVDDNNSNYSSLDGVLFNKDKTKLIQYPIGNTRTEYSIPDSVTSTGYVAFENCKNLTSITIGNGLTFIESSAFEGCTNLTNVTIPDSVTSIGYDAFNSCTSIKDVYYSGSEADWNEISFEKGNDALLNASIHFLCLENVDTGITVSGEKADTLPANTQLIVEKVSSTNEEVKYDITLQKNGVEIQPNGNVTVKIPVPQNMEGNSCKVYRQEEDGSKTDMNAVYENGYMVFTTEHFSVYTLEEKAFIYGDLNGDNIINKKDSLLLKMYLADDTTNINQLAADVYADGIINKKDSLYLKQYLAGLDIELGK